MLALFMAVSCALALVLWADWQAQAARCPAVPHAAAGAPNAANASAPVPQAPLPQPPAQPAAEDADASLLARVMHSLAEPASPAGTAAAAEDLPRITGFGPRDVLDLEITGPLPQPEDLRFEQIGRDAMMLLEGQPMVIFEGVPARHLRPSHIRFRSPQAA